MADIHVVYKYNQCIHECLSGIEHSENWMCLFFLLISVPPNENKVKLFDDANTGGYTNGAMVKVDENQQHTFTCSVEDTRPSADIEWKVDGTRPNNDFTIVPPATPTSSDQLVDSASTMAFIPSRTYHRIPAECISSIAETGTNVTRNIIFDVYGKY